MLLHVLFLLFALAGLFAVTKMVLKIVEQHKCLDDDLLLDFFKGKLSKKEDLRRKVISHLGVCEKCQQRLIELKDETPD